MITYPPIDLAHLRAMTDCTGLLQHAVHSVPNRRLGYTTDDNARALIVATQQYEKSNSPEDLKLAIKYLSFIHYAHTSQGRFRNEMNFQRDFLDEQGTEDCYGRAMWACGYAASSKLPENVRIVARKLFVDSIGTAADLNSPRARAYTILGMYHFLRGCQDEIGIADKIDALADTLVAGYQHYSEGNWRWFEPYLTYGNSILALGMFMASQVTGKPKHRRIVEDVLGFLTDTLFVEGRLEVIGNDGWYVRGGKRAWFDQQSIDAGYAVLLYAYLYKFTQEKHFLELAHIANKWFFGANRVGLWVYDPESKGCYDAIAPWGLNLNQGAEACVAYLLAQQIMQSILIDES